MNSLVPAPRPRPLSTSTNGFDLKRWKLVDNVDKIYYFLFELQSDLVLFVEGRMASNIFQSGVL